MHAPFLGFGPEALAWFEGLAKDNTKAYFDGSRTLWESQVRDPLERLLEELAEDLGGGVKIFPSIPGRSWSASSRARVSRKMFRSACNSKGRPRGRINLPFTRWPTSRTIVSLLMAIILWPECRWYSVAR